MPVTLVQPASLDLRQSAQALELEAFDRSVQFAEVLFDPSVGQLGNGLGLEGFDRGTKLTHASSLPNIRSRV
jgi:hypothetical protein